MTDLKVPDSVSPEAARADAPPDELPDGWWNALNTWRIAVGYGTDEDIENAANKIRSLAAALSVPARPAPAEPEIRTLPSGRTFERKRCQECGAFWDVPCGDRPTWGEPEPEWHERGCKTKGKGLSLASVSPPTEGVLQQIIAVLSASGCYCPGDNECSGNCPTAQIEKIVRAALASVPARGRPDQWPYEAHTAECRRQAERDAGDGEEPICVCASFPRPPSSEGPREPSDEAIKAYLAAYDADLNAAGPKGVNPREQYDLLRHWIGAAYAIDFTPPWPHGIGEHGEEAR